MLIELRGRGLRLGVLSSTAGPHSDIPAVQQVPVDVHPDGVIHGLADLPGLIADW